MKARFRSGSSRACVAVLTAGLAAAAVVPSTAQEGALASGEVLPLSSALRVRVVSGSEIALEARLRPGESWPDAARRVVAPGRTTAAAARSDPPAGEAWIRVPLRDLSDPYRALVLLNLFPLDRYDGEDWLHTAKSGALPTYDESLAPVAEWFTGDRGAFETLRTVNGLASPELARGAVVKIPASILHPALRRARGSPDGTLVYGKDDEGPYAGYRLKAGEALYSSVVLRFTGRVAPEDVEALARTLATRSGIEDPKDIPVAWLVKIPFEVLEPEFLPPDDPRRRKADAERVAAEAELDRRPVRAEAGPKKGLLVILDPGHGGADPGTTGHGIWEHDYVYDVACRLKARLERDGLARVVMTLVDERTGTAPSDRDALVANHQGTIRTNPPFTPGEDGETALGVNLRWYLANSVFRKATAAGTDPDRVVFVSLHADSRHPSAQGVMVYVPGARYRQGTHGYASSEYVRFAEVRERPRITFGRKDRLRSEAVSRQLAQRIVKAFKKEGLSVQKERPVRERVIRGRRDWLPAVLRGNAVPAKVLVELVNLSNAADARALAKAAYRERLAEALAAAIVGRDPKRP